MQQKRVLHGFSTFVFAYAHCRFSHDTAHNMFQSILISCLFECNEYYKIQGKFTMGKMSISLYLKILNEITVLSIYYITKTSPCNKAPLTPHFYIVKQGFTGVCMFLIFTPKHRLWVLVRTASVLTCTHNLCFEQKKITFFKI